MVKNDKTGAEGMRIAIAGKGGVGKTTIAGTLARILAKEREVIAIDADPAMNLRFSLGINENPRPISELKDLIAERTGANTELGSLGVFKLNPKVDDVLANYGVRSEGITLLVMGTVRKGGGGCTCPEHAFLRALLRHIFKRSEHVVMDCEAGIEHLGRGTARGVDIMLAVVEPSMNAVETAIRIKSLSSDIGISKFAVVFNKVPNEKGAKHALNPLVTRISAENIPIVGFIPYDSALLNASIEGIPPFEASPAFVEHVKALKDEICDMLR